MNPGANNWIGVLGGGQLGRMLALDARRMGFKVLKWTGGDVSGAAYTADLVFEEPFDDPDTLEQFIDRVDVATVEFENVPQALLEAVEARIPLMPGSKAVTTCQHREREKRFLSKNGFPCARFETAGSAEELKDAFKRMQSDVIVKTAEFGYDGKGQKAVDKGAPDSELDAIWDAFDGARAVVEEKIDLAAEFSVIVCRGANGESRTFDPAENQHRNHILDVSILPSRLEPEPLEDARKIAVSVAESMDYIGVLAVEFFIDTQGRVLVNELAPRAHNSGHHTIDACATSQFGQQVRAISGLPLGSVELFQPAVMWNLLGDLWPGPETPPDWSPILATPGANLHIYGKSGARPGRKMGHVTFVAPTREEAIRRASECRVQYGLPPID